MTLVTGWIQSGGPLSQVTLTTEQKHKNHELGVTVMKKGIFITLCIMLPAGGCSSHRPEPVRVSLFNGYDLEGSVIENRRALYT